MPVIQAIQTVVGRIAGGGGPPPPPPVQGDFFWAGDQDNWLAFGGIYTSSTYSNPEPANPSFAYLDGSYTGKTRDFTGTEWMSSPNLGIGGAWQTNTISINLWFYPTANGVQIMSESNVQGALNSYHYTVLEIDSSNHVKAVFWHGSGNDNRITSVNTVTLNQWNHIYFAEDSQGGHIFELNGVGTTGNPVYFRTGPGSTSEYFVIGQVDATSMGNTGAFQGKLGYLQINDYVAGSSYSNNWAKFNLINTGSAIGPDWTIEFIAELYPVTYWAAMWGAETYDNSQGYFAYFQSSSSLNVGASGVNGGLDSYNVSGIETIGYWAFTHISGQGIKMYRNGVLVNPNVSSFSAAAGGDGTTPLLIGSRHTNSGTGSTDPCPGNYYWYNVSNNTAKDATAILASYDAIKGTYGLP